MSTLSLSTFVRPARGGSAARALAGTVVVLAGALVLDGCAVRLGGPQPEEYRVLTLRPEPGASAAAVAARIREAKADIAFIVADRDSAWFVAVGAAAALHLSGPAARGGASLGFLAGEALGDTTVVLTTEDGRELAIQDALYQVDEDRVLDLMGLHLPAGTEPKAAARALLAYVATDVMSRAAVVLAVSSDDPGADRRLEELLEPAFTPVSRCEEAGPDVAGGVRILYGPALRIRCATARPLPGDPPALLAELVVRR